jgi:putative PEP-CTERM system histidine kinase
MASMLIVAVSVYSVFRDRTAATALFGSMALLFASLEIASMFALMPQHDSAFFMRAALFVESLIPFFSLLFALRYARQITSNSISLLWKILVGIALIFPVLVVVRPLSDFFYSPDLKIDRMLFLNTLGYWFYIGLMVYCVMVLMNLEVTFSATRGSDRYRIKFEMIGIISIIAMFIFYYSQGLLYRTINMNLIPLRSGILILGSIMIGYSRLLRGNGVKIALSRYVFYRSLTLLAVGLYLLTLGLIGEGLLYLGVSLSRNLMIFIGFVCSIFILVVLLSEQLRRKTKVYISKHFYAHKHDYREEWLKFTETLSSCTTITHVYGAILSTFKETFGLKGVSLYLPGREEGRYERVAGLEMYSEAELQLSNDLVDYFIDRNRVFDPACSEYAPSEAERTFVEETGARLMFPLTANGKIAGVVVFGEQLVSEEYIYEDYDLMKTLSRQACFSIVNFSLSEELAETREITAMAKISSFVMHDLKNLTTTLSLLLENAGEYIADPDFQNDMLETISNTVNKMKVLMQKLTKIPEKQKLKTELADLNQIARETVAEVIRTKPGTEIQCQGASVIALVDVEEIRKVILNLVLNALDALGGDGVVKVETGINKGKSYVTVMDNGCGMDGDFIRNHLFRPFRTTKNGGLGIGLYQCRQIAEAHGGDIDVDSELGKGSVFTVQLPALPGALEEERCTSFCDA